MTVIEIPLCIIPARGSSKRLSRKNIALLAGKPLLAYSIEAALQSQVFNEVLVSTEDEEIAEIARKWGAFVPSMRPQSLATDSATIVDVSLYEIDKKEKSGYSYRSLCVIEPPCPLVSSENIREALELFERDCASFLVSITDYEHPPFWALKKESSGLIVPYWGKEFMRKTQELPRLYRPNGAISLASVTKLKEEGTFYGQGLIGYYMPRSQSIDIDDAFDLQLAEFLIRRRDS